MQSKTQRPVFLDLRILTPRMPLVAILSILNRATGALLFVSAPVLIYLLGLSLDGPAGYEQALALLDNFLVKLWLFVLIWAVAHHMLSGIRFLLIDIDVGVELEQAQKSALWVLVAGGTVAAITLIGIML
ncbi:MAG: succinate dehydrogenase, cytochrome b556 subunit [Gammaproteobacteria bacterium]|nr:MAG: succinate dehydrogenase, cytochrome b556 subunit [Gammaproteobacteria bacterium]